MTAGPRSTGPDPRARTGGSIGRAAAGRPSRVRTRTTPGRPRPSREATASRRIDRNVQELLQEVRVTQTGVQILFAFLLGLAFTPRFAELNRWQNAVYLGALLLTAASAALLIAPVAYHRLIFRRRLRPRLVTFTHYCAVVGLALLLLAISAAVQLATGLLLGGWGVVPTAGVALLFLTLWFVTPLVERSRHRTGRPVRRP